MGYFNYHSAEVQFRKKLDKALKRIQVHHRLKSKKSYGWDSDE